MPRTKAKARARRAETLRVQQQTQRDAKRGRQDTLNTSLNDWNMFAEQSVWSRYHEPSTQDFTMAQEARNTERYGTGWRSQGQLRKLPVNFVRSGPPKNNEQQNSKPNDTRLPKNGQFPSIRTAETDVPSFATKKNGAIDPSSVSTPSPTPDQQPKESGARNYNVMSDGIQSLVLDTTDKGSDRALKDFNGVKEAYRNPESQNSSDSEDIVLFNGRGRQPRQLLKKSQGSLSKQKSQNKTDISIRQDSVQLPASNLLGTSSSGRRGDTSNAYPPTSSLQTAQPDLALERELESDDVQCVSSYLKRIAHFKRGSKEEENAVLQDYIDNVCLADDSELGGNRGGVDEANKESELSWDSDDLKDLDNLSTSDEEPPKKVKRILSKRIRGSGLQYLVHAERQSIDDARWIPSSRLGHVDKQIGAFEARYAKKISQVAIPDSTEGATSEANEATDDLLDEIASEEDEREAVRKITTMKTDQQIAHALSRQEMFSLPGDEVFLLDGTFNGDNTSDETMDLADEEDSLFRQHRNYNQDSPSRGTRKSRRRDGFPSASAFADALDQDPYGAFDVMDFERPSLKPKSKGGRARVNSEVLEDDELAVRLQQSWETDRQKKKLRKLERQKLREQGELGQKKDRIDMKAKYPHGIKHPQIKAEVKGFMLSPSSSMAFPPMHAHQRAFLHSLAAKVKVTSKSQGSGSERFTVLTKKKSTLSFDPLLPEDIDVLLSSRKVGKGKGKAPTLATTIARRKGANGAKSGVVYRDGEVVGAAAPEIGTENKGRAMLEKMGWTSGTALGAFDNKGILQPVAHVVKNSKTGLG